MADYGFSVLSWMLIIDQGDNDCPVTGNIPHILLLEPYYGGSHKAFLKGLQKHLDFRFTLIRLPARKWKMRMQLAAPWMAEKVIHHVNDGEKFDAVLCSTFIDLATFKALLAQKGIHIPSAMYFHENQFAYPNQINDPAKYQFSALNFTSALVADSLAFNSHYNRETFLEGVGEYLNKAADMNISHMIGKLNEKSWVLNPGIDFSDCNQSAEKSAGSVPVILWNHRWEHDKDPETFFATMLQLAEEGREFELIILGQHFERCPDIFDKAGMKLKSHIIQFGYVPDRKEYIKLLSKADIVVSTALHEFFGMAVLEAVHCGCRPLVPDRLSYRELFPEKYRYKEGGFTEALSGLLQQREGIDREEARKLTDRFSWQNMGKKYEQWLTSLICV